MAASAGLVASSLRREEASVRVDGLSGMRDCGDRRDDVWRGGLPRRATRLHGQCASVGRSPRDDVVNELLQCGIEGHESDAVVGDGFVVCLFDSLDLH